jgi:pimeloyl-ACP methyl ester carboxylesterase
MTYRRIEGGLRAAPRVDEKPSALVDVLRDVRLSTPSGLAIAAWYVPSQNGAAIVYLHGSMGDRRTLLAEAMALQSAGYGALLLDAPGFGASEGHVTWGRDAQDAVSAAIDFVASQPEVQGGRIGAVGSSMGTSVVAHVAARDPRIRAVVLEGAFTTLDEQLAYEFRRWGPATRLPAVWACERAGIAFDQLRTTEVIARLAPRPQLFVAGDRDPIVPLEMTRSLYDLAGDPKELAVIAGADHGGYARVEGPAYYQRVRAFFDRALSTAGGP